MKLKLPYSKIDRNKWFRWITIDLICFVVVSIVSFGFCYAYFRSEVKVVGVSNTATVSIEYRYEENGDASSIVYAEVAGSIVPINSMSTYKIVPGETIVIKGYAVNTSNVDVYVMGKLKVESKGSDGEMKASEITWFNINNGEFMGEDGLGIGASSLSASVWGSNSTIVTPDSAKQELSLEYTFNPVLYENGDSIFNIEFTLSVHQKDFLSLADDYNDFYELEGYTHEQVYAAHCITGLFPVS